MNPERCLHGNGFTIFELMIVIAIIAIVGALAVPGIRSSMLDQRLKDQIFDVNSAIERARSEAIRTGNNHLVFVGTDAVGSALVDSGGNTVPVLILNDGRPGSAGQNCLIDGGEPIEWVDASADVGLGVLGSPGNAPTDLGAGTISTGSSFQDPGGTDSSWLLFRADGAPVSFDSACAIGSLGTGAGAFYLQNGRRTAAVSVSPTGNVRVHLHQTSWSQ